MPIIMFIGPRRGIIKYYEHICDMTRPRKDCTYNYKYAE